jgi:HEAT repeat protein
LLLIGILADAPEVAARKPLLEVVAAATDPAVKAAAVDCLAVHGTAEDVSRIAQWAATGDGPVKAAAKRTLQRMSGPGVEATLIRLIESGDAGPRRAIAEALPSRRMTAALPALIRLLRGSDPGLAAEAAKAIGQMGGLPELKELAQILAATREAMGAEGILAATVSAAAQGAVQAICIRSENRAACAAVILGELERASTPAARGKLLPLTVFTGGEPALTQVVKGLEDASPEVRQAAFLTLVAWPETRAAAPLLRFAETNSEPKQAILALREGCLRLAEIEEAPAAGRAAILRGVLQVARRPEEKRRAVALMGQVPSLELLEFQPRIAADPDLRTEAIAPERRKMVEDGMKAVRNAGQSPEGYLLGWLISGPFTAPDQEGSALFDLALPPEKTGAQVEWRPFAAPANGIVDLGAIMPGDNRVAYLRTVINSEQEQPALLELGSDDGVKVWLNGAVVHANNAVRPCAPGQDKAKVTLKQGDNVLLLKVTQGGGQFAAVARLRAPDGKPLPHVTVGAANQ